MTDRTLRLGILGTGNIARQFAAGVRASRRCAITAVGSRSGESAGAFARELAVPNAHGSYDSLIRDPDVDAIYVSAPNSLHHEWTIKALAAGKHVLCEKPFAMDASEAQEMFDAADRSGRVLAEAFMYLCHPQTRAVVQAVRDGAIGELRLVRSAFCYATGKIDGNVRFDRRLGGGALMDVGCYCISLARLLFEAEPSFVGATATMHERGVDAMTSAVLGFPGGRQSTFTCAMQTHGDNAAHICGSQGWMEIAWPWKPGPDRSGYTLARSIPPRQDQPAATAKPPIAGDRQHVAVPVEGELFGIEADAFAAAVFDGVSFPVGREFTLGNMRVLDEIRRQIGLSWGE
jgi:predicted dehydrogenase